MAGACRTCGAPVEWRSVLDDRGVRAERIPLDIHEVITGSDRYTVNENGEAVRVAEHVQVMAQTDHRATCGQAAGGRR